MRRHLLMLSTVLAAVACHEPLGVANRETSSPAPATAPRPQQDAHARPSRSPARARPQVLASESVPVADHHGAQGNVRLARMLLQAGDARGAFFESALAVRRDPDGADGWHLRGRAALALGELASAREDLESAAILDPRDGRKLNDFACALLLQDEPIPAVALLENAAQVAPDLGFVRRNLAIAYARLGRGEDARAALARASELGAVVDGDSDQRPWPAPLELHAPPPAPARPLAPPTADGLAPTAPFAVKQGSDDVAGADFQEEPAGEGAAPADCAEPRSAGR